MAPSATLSESRYVQNAGISSFAARRWWDLMRFGGVFPWYDDDVLIVSRDVVKLPLRFQRRPFPSEAIDSSALQTRWLVAGGET